MTSRLLQLSMAVVMLITCQVIVQGTPIPPNVQAALGKCNPNTFTVSGISAGACMSIQFQYAWSSIVKGVGLVAAAPYLCAGGSLSGAELCLEMPSLTSVNNLLAEAQGLASAGAIDPLSNLENQTVYMFSGLIDTVVPQQNMVNAKAMYESLNVAHVTTYFNYTAEHAWVTNKYGNTCSYLGSPYLNNCNIDFAGNFLSAAFKSLGVKWNSTMGVVKSANLFSFQQSTFGASPSGNSLANTGYIYIPYQCQTGAVVCHLHMNLHGCTQDADSLGHGYMLKTEINEWAESNNIIVLYPQADKNLMMDNPEGCFDWWGYAGANYAQKGGAQISVLRKMITKYGGF